MKNRTDLLSLHENKIDMCKKLQAIFTSTGRQLVKSISLIINVNLNLNTNDINKILSSYFTRHLARSKRYLIMKFYLSNNTPHNFKKLTE